VLPESNGAPRGLTASRLATLPSVHDVIALDGFAGTALIGVLVRQVWFAVAGQLGVRPAVAVPWLLLLLAVPIAVGVTNLVAFVPARRAAGVAAADALRREQLPAARRVVVLAPGRSASHHPRPSSARGLEWRCGSCRHGVRSGGSDE